MSRNSIWLRGALLLTAVIVAFVGAIILATYTTP